MLGALDAWLTESENESLRRAVGEWIRQVYGQRHPGADVNVVEPVAVVVEMGDALVLPVRPLGDDRPDLALGAVERSQVSTR